MNAIFRSFFLCVIALFVLFSAAVTVRACSCSEVPTVDREFSAARNVVLVKAVSHLENGKARLGTDEGVSGFNFVVQKVYKGTALKPGERLPIFADGMCSFGFEASDLGREYLIYYFSDERFSVVPMCTRSAAAEWRAADIRYIEKVGKVRGMTRISGTLSQEFRASAEGENSRHTPVSDRKVQITGEGRNVLAETDQNGVFEVYGLPPGSYRIRPERLKGFVPTDSINRKTELATVVVRPSGHAEVDFYYQVENSISGTLLGADGDPLAGIRLDLVPAQGKPAKYFVETAYPDKKGVFKFERIPPGTYVIVGNRENRISADYPYPQFYSSGAGDRSTAQELTIGPGEFLKGIVVRAPQPVETVSISGRLLFADGSAVATGTVKFVGDDGQGGSKGDGYTYPDKAGNYTLKLLKGQKGVIFGYVPLNSWAFRDCPDSLKAVQLEADRSGMPLPETSRISIESASETSGVDLTFAFTLCRAR